MAALSHRLPALLLAALLALLLAPASATATPGDPPRLSITPVDHPGPWFDLELAPGSTKTLQVAVGNHGSAEVAVHTYAADTYTLVNGGMGVNLADDPTDTTVQWLDYPPRTITLPPGKATQRQVIVTVPDHAQPGQYLAALVIENDTPFQQGQGDLALDHVLRQALAVNITVPGPARPTLTINSIDHDTTADRSVIGIGLDNPGNRHLQPSGTLTVTDADGQRVARRALTPDRIYAGTSARLEIALDRQLATGSYTAQVTLTDEPHDLTETFGAPLEVTAPAATSNRSVAERLDGVTDTLRRTGLPAWTLILVAAVLLVVLMAVTGRLRRTRRSRIAPTPLTGPHTTAAAAPYPRTPVPTPRPAPIHVDATGSDSSTVPTSAVTPVTATATTVRPADRIDPNHFTARPLARRPSRRRTRNTKKQAGRRARR